MNIDVSELKAFRHCKRQWQLSSRNQFHLRACATPVAFRLGTIFHESLHKLYLGKDIEEVKAYICEELQNDDKNRPMLLSMINGYDREVMPEDREKYTVLDIEHHFSYTPADIMVACGVTPDVFDFTQHEAFADVNICGSIDMIVVDNETNEIWGFEHKTAKNFRNDIYLWMDEQPRLYYGALIMYVDALNDEMRFNGKEQIYKVGGVFINEVRKLVRTFDYKRSTLKYAGSDLRNFMIHLMTSVAECHKLVNNPRMPRVPQPDLMTCGMCQFNTICQEMQYKDLKLEDILAEFSQEFEVREQDHLEEKTEVDNLAAQQKESLPH